MGLFSEYLLEDIEQKAKDISENDIMNAVDKGLSVFWREVQISFPNMKTKDLHVEMANKFREAATEAMNSLLQNKRPDEIKKPEPAKSEGIPTHNSFNRNPFATQNQQWNIS